MLKKILFLLFILASFSVNAATISNRQAWITNYVASGTSVTNNLGGGASGGLNPVAGNLVIVTVEQDILSTALGITDNFGDTGGTTWAEVGPATFTFGGAIISIWWRQVGSGGAITGNTVTASWTGTHSGDIQTAEYQPSAASIFSTDGTSVSLSDQSGTNPVVGSITTTQAGLVLSYLNEGADATTAGAGFTFRLAPGSLLGKPQIEDYITSSGGSVSVSWTNATSSNWSGIGVAFKAASGGSSSIATINGLAKASVGTVNGLAIGSVSGVDGLP